MIDRNGTLSRPCLVVHGGAGTFARAVDPSSRAELERMLATALDAGWGALVDGAGVLAAAVEAVSVLEDSGLFNAGRGSSPTTAGTIEMDAAVMDGGTGSTGAVCAVTGPASPIRVARAVADLGGPAGGPILLAGAGADAFGRGTGLPAMGGPATPVPGGATSEAGTVGAVALDRGGHVAAATSTGGREGQLPGRIGDSPIVGAGTWASDDTAAVSATGVGEAFLVAGFAHRMDWSMRAGVALAPAMHAALDAVAALGGSGGAIGLTASGEFTVAFDTPAMAMGWRDADTAHAVVVTV